MPSLVPYPIPNLEVQGLSFVGSLPIGQSNVVGPTGHQSSSRHSCWVLLGTLKRTSFITITRQAQDGDRVTYPNGEGKYVGKFPNAFYICGVFIIYKIVERFQSRAKKIELPNKHKNQIFVVCDYFYLQPKLVPSS